MTFEGVFPVLSALGGGLVSGLFVLAGARFNQKSESKREAIRRLEESRERLRDERRQACVRLVAAAEVQIRGGAADAALGDARDTLFFLGPENLVKVSAKLASAADGGQKQMGAYAEARAAFYTVAKEILGYYEL